MSRKLYTDSIEIIAEVQALCFELQNETIQVVSTEEENIVLEYGWEQWGKKAQMYVHDGELVYKSGEKTRRKKGNVKLILYVPKECRFHTVKIASGDGTIHLENVTAEQLSEML